MQSGKDPDYATGKTKRNGTAGTDRSRQTRNATAGTERNRQTRNKTGKSGTQTGNPNRHANETNPQPSERNATGKPGTEHNWNRPTRNGTGAKHD